MVKTSLFVLSLLTLLVSCGSNNPSPYIDHPNYVSESEFNSILSFENVIYLQMNTIEASAGITTIREMSPMVYHEIEAKNLNSDYLETYVSKNIDNTYTKYTRESPTSDFTKGEAQEIDFISTKTDGIKIINDLKSNYLNYSSFIFNDTDGIFEATFSRGEVASTYRDILKFENKKVVSFSKNVFPQKITPIDEVNTYTYEEKTPTLPELSF